MVNAEKFTPRWWAVMLLAALVLTSAACLRGAEYDEQYTLFLTAGTPRPAWPETVFTAGTVRRIQAGQSAPASIGHDLRATDVHPPLYFWGIALWRRLFGADLLAARLFSVLCGLLSLAAVGEIAQRSAIRPLPAMLLTLGSYGFVYTNVIARGFAPAQAFTLWGVAAIAGTRSRRGTLAAGALFGAACCCNYLAIFVTAAVSLRAHFRAGRNYPPGRLTPVIPAHGPPAHDPPLVEQQTRGPRSILPRPTAVWPRATDQPAEDDTPSATRSEDGGQLEHGPVVLPRGAPPNQQAAATSERRSFCLTLLAAAPFLATDAWFFAAQHSTRDGQFPPFDLGSALPRLIQYQVASLFGGLPLYVDGTARIAAGAAIAFLALALLAAVLLARPLRRTAPVRLLVVAAIAPPVGLVVLGIVFDNTPIELRYLSFGIPFICLLVAWAIIPAPGATPNPVRTLLLLTTVAAVQVFSILGLIAAPATMQPARATAAAAQLIAQDGVVLLPRGNDGVGIVGAFGINVPPGLHLLLIRPSDTPTLIRSRVALYHRVVLALLGQDRDSLATLPLMRQAFATPDWRRVASGFNVEAYERLVPGDRAMFFEGFTLTHLPVPGGSIRLRHGGSGPPLLLLHGNPQTHAMWHRIAPTLAQRFTVICPDLRGYGFSLKPPATPDHAPYAKAEMAKDMIAVMDHFGHKTFLLAGHDRGARLSHRIALDNPDRVEKLAVLDIIPTIEHFERANMDFALGYYHWFWFAQPHPFPEWLIDRAPEDWWRQHTGRDPSRPDLFHPDALADYFAAVRQPEMVRGMCEDYRAAIGIDLEHDRASRDAGLKVRCPMLVLWGAKGKINQWYDALDVWRQYCSASIIGGPVSSGHYIAEETPDETLAWFERFFG